MRTAALLLGIFLAGCISPPWAAPTSAVKIGREQAIAAAVRIASQSAPEISGALVTPQNIQAEQITLKEAMQRMGSQMQLPTSYRADTPVWIVTMDGLWASEAQAPGVAATQIPYHHYFVILGASTGMEIESELRP